MKDNHINVKNTNMFIKFLLLFKKTHFRSEHSHNYVYRMEYKKLFGRIYIIDDYLISFGS